MEASNVYLPDLDESVLKKRISRIKQYKNCRSLTIGTIANVDVRYKGQEYIIRAIAKLNKNGYDLKYELVGGGDQTFLKNLAKKYHVENCIVFRGALLHEDVIKWLDSIDVYAQPSKQEGLPRSVIEAMSRALPCIGSITAGIPELLSGEMLFAKGDVNQIVRILSEINAKKLSNQALRNYDASKKFDLKKLNEDRTLFYLKYSDMAMPGCKDYE